MYALYGSSTAAHVSSNAQDGAGRCSSSFLFNVFVGSLTLAFRNACTRKLFVIVLAIHFLFAILNAINSPFIGFFFTLLQLLCLCSDVGHYFLQGVMLVVASLNRALGDLNDLQNR